MPDTPAKSPRAKYPRSLIREYEKKLTGAYNAYQQALCSCASPSLIAETYLTYSKMQHEWDTYPGLVDEMERLKTFDQQRRTGPELWRFYKNKQASEEISYRQDHATQYEQKYVEYEKLAMEIYLKPNTSFRMVKDPYNGVGWLYRESPDARKLTLHISLEFTRWFDRHFVDKKFLEMPATGGLRDFLKERPDCVMLFRLVQTMPYDSERFNFPIERPVHVEILELAVSVIPLIGNVVAVWELWAGHDMFGYALSDFDKAVVILSTLLPFSVKLFKYGRAVYGEARLVKLYGADTTAWRKALIVSERASKNPAALGTLSKAEEVIRAKGKLEGALAKDAEKAIKAIFDTSAAVIVPVAEQGIKAKIKTHFATLAGKNKIWAEIDEAAIERILKKGPDMSRMQGQAMEELSQKQILSLVQSPEAQFVVGIDSGGKQIVYYPGHVINDSSGEVGKQFIDGAIGFWAEDVTGKLTGVKKGQYFELRGLVQTKSSGGTAAELFKDKTVRKIEDMSARDQKEFRLYARDVWREEKFAALVDNPTKSFTKTIEDVEKEVCTQALQLPVPVQSQRSPSAVPANNVLWCPRSSRRRAKEASNPASTSPTMNVSIPIFPHP